MRVTLPANTSGWSIFPKNSFSKSIVYDYISLEGLAIPYAANPKTSINKILSPRLASVS